MDGRTTELFSRGYRAWLLTLLLLIWAFNFADRFVIATLSQAIKLDLGISDFQIGLLQGLGFAVLYTALGLPIARLAERKSRILLIAGSMAVWSATVAAGGLARSFAQLMLARIGVGAGDAGFMTPVGSLLGDHYPPARRASAWSIINLASPIGSLVGAVLGGWIAQHYGWRTALVAVGLPGSVLALLAATTLREPPRGHAEGGLAADAVLPSTLEVFRTLFAKPAFRQVLIAAGLTALGMNGIGQFLFTFFVRTYHMGFAEAGLRFGLVSFFSLSAGLLLGGFGGDRLVRRDERWHAWGSAIGVVCAGPLYMIAFLQVDPLPATILIMVAAIFLFLFYAPTAAMIQNMATPLSRASAGYIYAFVLGVGGAGLGPTVLGLVSDLFAGHAFTLGDYRALCPNGSPPAGAAAELADACRAASALGLRNAVMTAAGCFLWGGLHFLLAARTLRADMHRAAAPAAAMETVPAAAVFSEGT
jgi:predicted MFS family arabinose efflux permease